MATLIDPKQKDLRPCVGEGYACELCCKLLEVRPIHKPQGKWCEHAQKKGGCRIQHVKPEACQTFDCLWRQGVLPLWAIPTAVHAVVTATTDGEHLVIHEDPGYRGDGRRLLQHLIDHFVEGGARHVVVVVGDQRTVIACGEEAARVAQKVEPSRVVLTDGGRP